MSEGLKRRDFLKVLGVSGAGATLAGCSTEVERIIPYVVPPEEITPGVATWYATVNPEVGYGCGLWVRTREGRAVKVEGNPAHPVNRGALDARAHSAIQSLYNPDRYRSPMVRDGDGFRAIGWDEAGDMLAERLRGAANPTLIAGRTGPSLSSVLERVASASGGTLVRYEPLSEAPLREATRMAFGRNVLPTFDMEASRLVVSFGADFLEGWISPVEHNRSFAAMSGARPDGSKGKLVFVGPRLPLTGLNADEWLPIRPGSEGVVALAMAHVIARGGADAGPYASLLQSYDPATAARHSGLPADVIEALAREFASSGAAVALPPGFTGHHRNATAANLAVLVLNAVAGNVGRSVRVDVADQEVFSGSYADLDRAIRTMRDGGSGAVLVHGVNPAYSTPASAGFADAFQQVPFKVSFASAPDETAALCDLILPDSHFLESWGDSNPRPGVWAVQQPVMRPVPHFDSRSAGDVLLATLRRLGAEPGADSFRDYVQGRWQELHASSGTAAAFDAFWRETLRTGVATLPAAEAGAVALQAADAALVFDPPAFDGADGDLFLQVHPSGRLGDGKFANRPWLLELPDSVSKIAWHSWVEMHPDTARERRLRNGDMVRLQTPHGELEVPVWTYAGIRPDTVALALGGGHENFGRFADGNGVNAMRLLGAEVENPSGALVTQALRVSVEGTGSRMRHATIEGSADDRDRPIVPAVAAADLGHGDDHADQGGHGHGLYELQGGGGFIPVPTDGRPEDFPLEGSRYGDYDPAVNPRWAMAVDLDKCTGCSACVVACQSENNVPWVGEDQVRMGRDMGWIRVERYWKEVDATHAGPVDVRFLPMMCQHCGNAPCEPVCPVYAAYHTPEGINGQVYNRCVGTRYCANNCPYKVRVFNWFEYTDVPEPMNWAYNPDVTVRANGVMEKCSFCTQRIREAQNRAALEGRSVRDGDIVTACQQSCPADAIVFGNIRDPESRVAQVSDNERTYRVLDYLINTQPGVNYLKKVTFHPVEGGH